MPSDARLLSIPNCENLAIPAARNRQRRKGTANFTERPAGVDMLGMLNIPAQFDVRFVREMVSVKDIDILVHKRNKHANSVVGDAVKLKNV